MEDKICGPVVTSRNVVLRGRHVLILSSVLKFVELCSSTYQTTRCHNHIFYSVILYRSDATDNMIICTFKR
jgi:hypothetical protein